MSLLEHSDCVLGTLIRDVSMYRGRMSESGMGSVGVRVEAWWCVFRGGSYIYLAT